MVPVSAHSLSFRPSLLWPVDSFLAFTRQVAYLFSGGGGDSEVQLLNPKWVCVWAGDQEAHLDLRCLFKSKITKYKTNILSSV